MKCGEQGKSWHVFRISGVEIALTEAELLKRGIWFCDECGWEDEAEQTRREDELLYGSGGHPRGILEVDE